MEKALNLRLNYEQQHIFKMQIVRGRDFYGYHHGQQMFIKIFVYDPGVIPVMISILHAGGILGHKFDVYEVKIVNNLCHIFIHLIEDLGTYPIFVAGVL